VGLPEHLSASCPACQRLREQRLGIYKSKTGLLVVGLAFLAGAIIVGVLLLREILS
jgi:hypothetical protein